MNIQAAAMAAFLLAGSAYAGEATVVVPAHSSYRMTAEEFKDYAATYALGNGRYIQFSRAANKRYFAQLEGEKADRMYPLAPGVLMTAGGARIEFSSDGGAVTIRNYEKLPMAVAPAGSNLTVASR